MRIETFSYNGFNIELPIGLERVMNTPVRDSYQEFLQEGTRDVRRHLTAACTLLPPILNKYGPMLEVLHPFGGVGATAQIIDQYHDFKKWPRPLHRLWDRDPVLVQYLNSLDRPNYITCQVEDSFKELLEVGLGLYDLIIFDMSVGTIKTPGVKEFWRYLGNHHKGPPVWFTDTSCHKMHLNYKSYAKDFGSYEYSTEAQDKCEEYLRAYSRWLRDVSGHVITGAMREAGEFYCVAQPGDDVSEFSEIPYL